MKTDFLPILADWYSRLPHERGKTLPARGTIAGAIVVLEHVSEQCDLRYDAHLTEKGKGQVRGVGGPAIAKVLMRHGETRRFLSEGGRTNRGLIGAIKDLLDGLREGGLAELAESKRSRAIDQMQAWLVAKAQEYLNRKRLKFVFRPGTTTFSLIARLLDDARAGQKESVVAQHLVGAKLQARFPAESVCNDSFTTADTSAQKAGDFVIRQTAFHVTVSPQPALFDKCRANLDAGLSPFVLVPERQLAAARQMAELSCAEAIWVQSIEAFVGQNVSELGCFAAESTHRELRRVLELYNARADSVEADKSVLLELPDNL